MAFSSASDSIEPHPRPTGRRDLWLESLLAAILTSGLLTLVAYAQNVNFMPLRALGQPLGVALAVALAVWLLSLALTRAPAAAGIVAVAVLFFNDVIHVPLFCRLQYAVTWPAPLAALRLPVLLASLPGFALLAWGRVLGRRRPAWCARVLGPLTLLLAANLLFAAVRLAVLEWRRPRLEPLFPRLATRPDPALSTAALPTIVHLVLDGYARNDILQTRYQTDNTRFTSNLTALGFLVIPRARSNYIQTALSLSSLMNLDYLRPPPAWSNLYDRTPLLPQIQSSRVVARLRASGYEIVNFPSGYDFTDDIGADVPVAPRFFNELSANQWERSWFGTLASGGTGESANHVRRIETVFEQLPGICAGSTGPQYIFAHVVAPHPPFLFDERGAIREPATFNLMDGSHRIGPGREAKQGYRDAYLAQLRYISGRTEALMTRLMETSSRPLVILLHSDHGPGSGLHWESRQKSDVAERLSILCALYFPEGRYEGIPEDLTLVNLFRIVFNRYLGADYPMLPNRTFFTRWKRPYRFEPVEPYTQSQTDW
jgi:hypothetical protein